MTSLPYSPYYQIHEDNLGYKSGNGNLSLVVDSCPKFYDNPQDYSIVDLFLNVSQTLKKSRLRSILNSEYQSKQFLVNTQIRTIVEKFIKELTVKTKKKNTSPMHQIFSCKCGWLLYNPATLPCGHTMCKHCADENLFCIYCGYTLDDACTPNLFLAQLINSWFPSEYTSTGHKKDAKTLYETEDFELALNEINLSLSLNNDDFSAYLIRAEIYLKLEEYKNALTDASKSCKLNTECGKAQFVRGNCFSHLGNLNQAIDAFQLCLELEPEDMALCNLVINRLDSILSLADTGDKLSDTETTSSDVENDELSNNEEEGSSCSSNVNCDKVGNSSESKETTDQNNKNQFLKDQDKLTNCESSSDHATKEKVKTVVVKKIHGVDERLIKEEEFECKLCYELMFKPITTTCGHVFCKNCLLRSLDHNASCPICRLSLSDFLQNPMKPVTGLIEELLEVFFSNEFSSRKRLHQEKMEKMSRVGVDESVEIPIFVCSIAFPYVKCPLHIFEPKYRLMIRECIESGSRKFGMCVPQVGEDYSDIGTICEISKIQNLPDGRYIINATAGQRFNVQQKLMVDSMNYAKVKYFTDEPEDFNSPFFSSTTKEVYDHLSQYVTSLNETEQDCIFNALGILPQFDANFVRFTHGIPWVWWGLAALPLNFTAKLVLLRSKCVSERMLSLQRFLRFLSRMQKPSAGESTS